MTVKQFLAVLMSVLLVTSVGSAVALSAADGSQSATHATQAVQGNETGNATGNDTVGNATGNRTGNVTNASITFENQTSNGTTVTVQRVMLNEGGFVQITGENGFSVGNSSYLEPGVQTNLTVQLDEPVAANQTLTAFAVRDVNDNQQFDGTGVENDTDQPYRLANGSVVAAEASVTVTGEAVTGPTNETADNETTENETNVTDGNVTDGNATNVTDGNATDGNATDGNATAGNATAGNATAGNATDGNVTNETAAVTFENQTADDTTVVVASTTVPEGGFVTIHDASLLEGDAVGSVVGVSEYLDAGVHENVTVELSENATVEENETLIAMPHLDSNGNETYDFVTSNGSEDPPYTANGSAVVEAAVVSPGANASADNATSETMGNATDGNATNASENETVAADLGDHNESDDGMATLEVPSEQSGDGTTLTVTNASAETAFYLEARANGTVYNTTLAFDAEETFSGALVLRPELVNVTTVEFNVTLREAAVNGSVLAQQNTTYTLETGNETADNATAGNVTNETATVTFENQTADDTTVTVRNVTVPEGGFVAIHDDRLLEGEAVGSVVGVSEYLEAGAHENVTVELSENVTFVENETLIAMPHLDSNGNETYDFVTSNGSEDPPYTANGSAVTDDATVRFGPAGEVVEGNSTDGNVTDGNETDGDDGDGVDY
jgi:hypothetical protein